MTPPDALAPWRAPGMVALAQAIFRREPGAARQAGSRKSKSQPCVAGSTRSS
jgi:hypothetical protein